MKLREIAHARSGDKGNTSTVCIFAYKQEDYGVLHKNLTPENVKKHFGELVRGTVTRYEIPSLWGLNFVMTDALAGGVTHSLNIDIHGKNYGQLLLMMDINK